MTRLTRAFDPAATALRLAAGEHRKDRLTHLEIRPAREAQTVDWPPWAHPAVVEAMTRSGVGRL